LPIFLKAEYTPMRVVHQFELLLGQASSSLRRMRLPATLATRLRHCRGVSFTCIKAIKYVFPWLYARDVNFPAIPIDLQFLYD
jgi:hypothetical protein